MLAVQLLCTPAYADIYNFTVQSSDLGKLQQAKNCIDYNVCETSYSLLDGGNPKYGLRTEVPLNGTELVQIVNKCSPIFLQYGVTILNEDTKTEVKYPFSKKMQNRLIRKGFISDPVTATKSIGTNISDWFNPRKHEAQVSVPAYDEANLLSIHAQIKSLLDTKKWDEAIAFTIQSFGFDPMGYRVYADPTPKLNQIEAAVSDHANRTIRLAAPALASSCGLVLCLRHELEHVHQIAQASRCINSYGASVYQDHYDRERAAYLNDVFNVRSLCPDQKAQADFIDGHTMLIYELYRFSKSQN